MRFTPSQQPWALHCSRPKCPVNSSVIPSYCSYHAPFSTLPPLFSGHSRWSKIKHDKGVVDAAKNKQRSVLAKEIQTASKLYGPSPTSNPRLSTLVSQAKKAGFPQPRIAAAIARGQGISVSGAALEPLTLEILLPPSNVALVVECLTDNPSRTRQDVAEIMRDYGAREGSVRWMFERKGRIEYIRDGRRAGSENHEAGGEGDLVARRRADEEEVLEWAIEAGVEDVEYGEADEGSEGEEEEGVEGNGDKRRQDRVTVWTEVEDVTNVREDLGKNMEAGGWKEEGVEILWRAKGDAKVEVGEHDTARLEEFATRLGEDTAVQDVYVNAADFEMEAA